MSITSAIVLFAMIWFLAFLTIKRVDAAIAFERVVAGTARQRVVPRNNRGRTDKIGGEQVY